MGEGTQREIPGSWRDVFEGRETSDLQGEGADASKTLGSTGAFGFVVQRM